MEIVIFSNQKQLSVDLEGYQKGGVNVHLDVSKYLKENCDYKIKVEDVNI